MNTYLAAASYPTGAAIICNAVPAAYAMSALLPGEGGTNAWCIDSVGKSKHEPTNLASGGASVCP